MFGNPAFVVGLASRDAGGLRAGDVSVGSGLDLLGLAGRAASLGEQGLDPGLVDEVESSSEGTSEEEVQEDAKERTQRSATSISGSPT